MASPSRSLWSPALFGALVLCAAACSSSATDSSQTPASGGNSGTTAGSANGGSSVGGANSAGFTSTGGSQSAAGSGSNAAGTTGTSGGAGGSSTAGSAGATSGGAGGGASTFWDPSGIPAAKNIMMFKFLNRTNGKYTDDKVFWSFKNAANNIDETHSIAEQPLYDMPGNNSGRMYFYVEEANGKYYDFIEFTIGGTTPAFNGNTTRVDAFGLKIAMLLHCSDNFEASVGENEDTFAEDRTVTFQKFMDEAPAEFKNLAMVQAPYRIVEPGAGGFNAGGMYADYYDSFVDQLWSANGLTITKPGPNGSGLGAYPDISAAIMRHVGAVAGTFSADGKLMNNSLWKDATTFYTAAPADYYARFWHERAINGKAYGFPYDDVGGYSSYISHQNPQYLEVAIGF
ncbi:MAG TPA: beta-1,3-glucanase family protein [Polyangiaceae bacterium]|nr:beta-1,3-glucanase family protein [Polyangiaceae bacterium]